MERVPLLSEIDDEKHYAQLLEVSYCEAATELNVLVARMSSLNRHERHSEIDAHELEAWYRKLCRLQWVMIGTVGDSTARRRRLANIT